MLDEDYIANCKQIRAGGKIDEHYEIKDEVLCSKNRLYVPRGLTKPVMDSEHDFKVAGHFGRERTMELLTRNFDRPNMEKDVRTYCNECDNCQRTKAP